MGPVALRKYLQNDEVMEYAFGHSDLFYPFSLQASVVLCGTAQGFRTSTTLRVVVLWPPQARRVVQRQASEIYGIL
jgi:hypothetical protein